MPASRKATKPNQALFLDYDEQGDLVSLEVLDASKRVFEARKIEFQTME